MENQPQRHQLYRAKDREVILLTETEREVKDHGILGKILTWSVQALKRLDGDRIVRDGEPFEVPASDLQPLHRVVTL